MSVSIYKCLQAWTNSLRQLRIKADIVFFGDSLTYYGDFSNLFSGKTICNLGLRGDSICGMIGRVEQVKTLHPKQVYLMAGINDVGSLALSEFMEEYSLLVQSVLSELPDTRLVLQSILPVNSLEFGISCDNKKIIQCNRIIKEIAEARDLSYIDIFTSYYDNGQMPLSETIDGLHLKPEAYLKWYDIIRCYNEENDIK